MLIGCAKDIVSKLGTIRFRCVNYVNVSKELFAHADANFSCR